MRASSCGDVVDGSAKRMPMTGLAPAYYRGAPRRHEGSRPISAPASPAARPAASSLPSLRLEWGSRISLLLGHPELRVTADLYSHLQKQTAAKAARYMDAALAVGGGAQGVS